MRTIVLISILALALTGCASQPDYRAAEAPPQTVSSVDLERYAGKWFEIARYPNRFEENCYGVTAEYIRQPDGEITVINTCREGSLDAEPRQAKGFARVVESSGNSKLKVQFAPRFVPFASGDYWILHLEEDYSAALVGDPDGKYLWILARTPALDETILAKIKGRAEALGYATEPLFMTPQSE